MSRDDFEPARGIGTAIAIAVAGWIVAYTLGALAWWLLK